MAGGRRIQIDFLGRDVSAGKTADQVANRFGKFSEKARKWGPAIALGMGAAGVAAIKFGRDSIHAASEAQQSLGGTQAVFGKFADTVIKRSNEAANAFGLSANEYRQNANIIGSLLKNQGVAQDKLGDSTDRMIKLGSDLAATYGGTTKQAVEALASAYKGEFDPLEQFGISLKQSAISAEALKVAGVATTAMFNKLTPAQQKAAMGTATQNLLMKQAAPAQGQFAKQTGTLAEKQQILAARFENLQATLGQKLLPIATKVTGWATDAIGWMGKHQSLIKGIASVVLPLVVGLYSLAKAQAAVNLVMTANPIGLVIVAVAALAAGLIYAYKHSETFRKIVNGAFAAVKAGAKLMWDGIKPIFSFLIKTWLTVAGAIVNGAAKAFGWVPGIGPKLKKAAAWFNDFRDQVNNKLNGIHDKKVKISAPGAAKVIGDLQSIANLTASLSGVVLHASQQMQHRTRRATGGRVAAGQVISWNENGREMFMSNTAGTVATAQQTRRAQAGTTVTHVLDLRLNGKTIRKMLLDEQRAVGHSIGIN